MADEDGHYGVAVALGHGRADATGVANLRMGRHAAFAFAAPQLCLQWQF